MKIVVFEAEKWERKAFENLAADHETVFSKEPLSGDNTPGKPFKESWTQGEPKNLVN
jgi:hypothetical protein